MASTTDPITLPAYSIKGGDILADGREVFDTRPGIRGRTIIRTIDNGVVTGESFLDFHPVQIV